MVTLTRKEIPLKAKLEIVAYSWARYILACRLELKSLLWIRSTSYKEYFLLFLLAYYLIRVRLCVCVCMRVCMKFVSFLLGCRPSGLPTTARPSSVRHHGWCRYVHRSAVLPDWCLLRWAKPRFDNAAPHSSVGCLCRYSLSSGEGHIVLVLPHLGKVSRYCPRGCRCCGDDSFR